MAIKVTEPEGRDAPAAAASMAPVTAERFSPMFVSVVIDAAMVFKGDCRNDQDKYQGSLR